MWKFSEFYFSTSSNFFEFLQGTQLARGVLPRRVLGKAGEAWGSSDIADFSR